MKAYLILIALGILCALFSDKISKYVNVNTKLRVTLDILLVILDFNFTWHYLLGFCEDRMAYFPQRSRYDVCDCSCGH